MRFEVGPKIDLRLQEPLGAALQRHAERLFRNSKHGRSAAARRLLRDALVAAELAVEDTETVWITVLDRPTPEIRGDEWGLVSGYVPSVGDEVTDWLIAEKVGEEGSDTYGVLSPYDDSVSWEIQSREFTVTRSEWEALAWALENPDELHNRPWP